MDSDEGAEDAEQGETVVVEDAVQEEEAVPEDVVASEDTADSGED